MKKPIKLGHADSLKVTLTTKDGSKAKRPHQAFLVVKESSGLEAPYALTLKESGTGSVEIVCPSSMLCQTWSTDKQQNHKDLPLQLLLSQSPLEASLIIGSFGSSAGSVTPVFDIEVVLDSAAPKPKSPTTLRYGKLNEIHHIFRADPKNPPKIVSIFFSLAVLATIPAVFGGVCALSTQSCQTCLGMNANGGLLVAGAGRKRQSYAESLGQRPNLPRPFLWLHRCD